MKVVIKYLLISIVTFGVIQLIPYGKDHNNPQVLNKVKWDSPKTKELFVRACMDCHSNNTIWPWYSDIAPISWLVAYDVDEGREHFNISMIGYQSKNKANEAYETVQEGEMPPLQYIINHPEANLNDEETALLIRGLKRTF